MNPDWDDVMKNRARQPKPPANPPPDWKLAQATLERAELEGLVAQLEAECRGLHEQLQEARRFFLKCWDATREGYPMDGGDIQDWGVECGLLKAVTVSAPCGEGCVCDAYDGTYPTECYRPTFDASGARRVLE